MTIRQVYYELDGKFICETTNGYVPPEFEWIRLIGEKYQVRRREFVVNPQQAGPDGRLTNSSYIEMTVLSKAKGEAVM